MPKKKSNKEALIDGIKSDHLKRLESLLNQIYFRHFKGITHSGSTKSWLADSRRCRTQPYRYPKLVELPTESVNRRYPCYISWNPPPLGLQNINTLFKLVSRSCSYNKSLGHNSGDICDLMLTGGSNPAFMVCITPAYWDERNNGKEKRLITHKSTEIDPYGVDNQVVKLSYVIRARDRKYYALSSQGAFLVMEETDGDQIVVTGVCRTRAVPSSVRAKFFREYLFESKGEIMLVFLIYRESTLGLADEIEVLRFESDALKLVKVESLRGRALFQEKDCCVWVDSREIGCMDDCVYFTGGSGDGCMI